MLLDLPSVWQCSFEGKHKPLQEQSLCLNRKYFVFSGRKSKAGLTQTSIFHHVARTINTGLLICVALVMELEFHTEKKNGKQIQQR